MEIAEIKKDLNREVKSGRELGVVRYSKSYALVFVTLMGLIIGLNLVASMVDMRNPLVGILFLALMVYGVSVLVKFYER